MSQSKRVVSIGGVSLEAKDDVSYLVPVTSFRLPRKEAPQSELAVLRWMMQKALLKQDMFLLGPAGPSLRHLAFRFCELLGREMEYVAITQDTGEADLKQRCEISNGSIQYVDQPPVRAAIHGRILVLEGIEKAERNVLPLLNNLLENREMSLEDRRFLLSPDRAAELQQQLDQDQLAELVPVHKDFLVIALGSPDRGNPLDPPLRSRFAALQFRELPSEFLEPLAALAPSLPLLEIERLLLAASLLQKVFEGMATMALASIVKLLAMLPGLDARELLSRVCPAAAGLVPQIEMVNIHKALESLRPRQGQQNTSYSVIGVRPLDTEDSYRIAVVQFQKIVSNTFSKDVVEVFAPCGPFLTQANPLHEEQQDEDPREALKKMSAKQLRSWLEEHGVSDSGCLERSDFLSKAEEYLSGTTNLQPKGILSRPLGCVSLTPSQASLMSQMIMDHAAGADIALVGEKGSGKSTLVNAFATILGYRTRNLFCYRDMSSRDLLQRRTTDPWGNTGWSDSPLVQAALHGDLAVLHGVHRLPKGTLYATLGPLLSDRWCVLPDGTMLFSESQWASLMERGDEMKAALALGARKVNPSFRLVVCGDLPESFSGPFAGNWIDEEVSTLFHFHRVLDLPLLEQRKLVTGLASGEGKQCIDTLLSLSQKIKGACKDPDLKPLQLSLRALLRTARHLAFRPNDLAGALERCFSARFKFLEASQRLIGQRLLAEVGIEVKSDKAPVDVRIESGELHLGQVQCPQRHPTHPELVPKVQFVQISNHMAMLQNMLASWNAGQHLLLVGNQGVGKNKLADHLLCLLRCERQYIQLHRDTTVQSLTATPTLEAGVVCWQDSALLRAATLGHCVVVDEADKAPLEVVCILKALAEDSELTLPDGRTLVRHNDERLSLPRDSDQELVPVAAGFRMIVLANRPGRPFLGNDFYRVCGDVFDCHVVEYLDIASELELLRSIAPTVPEGQLATFSELFRKLRQLADAGHTTYPYSTRELVKIVSHAQQFPGDSIEYLAADVFSFDAFEDRQKLVEAFRHLGIAKGKDGEAVVFGESRGHQNLELGQKEGPP